MTQKEKTKFRSSSKWKDFRKRLGKERKLDEITKKPLLKGWSLHHLNEKNYADLNPNNFTCLNSFTHKVVHWLERYDNYEEVLDNLKIVVERMKSFK